MQKVSKTNTKQEIWEAYQTLIGQMQEQMHAERQAQAQPEKGQQGAGGVQAGSGEAPEELQEREELTFDKVMSGISLLKTNANEALNKLSDRLGAEMEKLDAGRRRVFL